MTIAANWAHDKNNISSDNFQANTEDCNAACSSDHLAEKKHNKSLRHCQKTKSHKSWLYSEHFIDQNNDKWKIRSKLGHHVWLLILNKAKSEVHFFIYFE